MLRPEASVFQSLYCYMGNVLSCLLKYQTYSASVTAVCSAGFTHKIGRLKPRVSTSSGPLVKIYTIFDRLNVLTIHHPASTHTHVLNSFFLVYNFFIWSMIQRGSDTSFINLWSLLLYIQLLLHYVENAQERQESVVALSEVSVYAKITNNIHGFR
jgi:hypothetical protein